MLKHERRLHDLLQTAKHVAPVAGARVAASLFLGNEIICVGSNSRKTHPLMAKFGKNDKAIYLHAEVDAIKNALQFLDSDELIGTTMYIARAKADGSAGLAKPCEGCQRALVAFGIEKVYWTE
jgi:tRNA(Arg) A34 adenosine deaminase TadA